MEYKNEEGKVWEQALFFLKSLKEKFHICDQCGNEKSIHTLVARMKSFFAFTVIIFCGLPGYSQSLQEEAELISRLNIGTDLPKDLLAARSVVFFQSSYTSRELETIQMYFQQTGIDAVAYLDIQRVLSGVDVQRVFASYFSTRKISYLILMQKSEKGYECIITEYAGTVLFTDKAKVSWRQAYSSLTELLQTIYRFCISTLKRKNFLINDLPETGIDVANLSPKHVDKFAMETKSFKVAIPKFSDAAAQAELESYLKDNFPAKYDFVDPASQDAELWQKGYRAVLRFIHTRGELAREILGYPPTQPTTSLATNYFSDGELKIKTIPIKTIIYKFYFKNLEYGDMYLGNKWDADETWQDALKNHIDALRIGLKF